MDRFVPGRLAKLEEIAAGNCILFEVDGTTRFGFVVEVNLEERGVLDLEYNPADGAPHPVIYSWTRFRNSEVLLYERARIVPDLSPGTARFGYYSHGEVTKALYVFRNELIVQAAKNRDVYRFNLLTGKPPEQQSLSGLYTTRWRVDVPGPDEEWQTVIEFSA